MTPPPPPPPGYWPHGAAAVAYLARVEALLKYRGLDGTSPRFEPLMKRIVAAFKARDIDAVNAACDAVVDEVEGKGD